MTDHVPHLPPHLIEGHSSLLRKATSARFLGHPLVWTAMTGLFILAGYFWLQYYARPLSEQIEKSYAEKELVGSKPGTSWNTDIYRPVETAEQMLITTQKDESRANIYREIIERENKIQPLLDQARVFMEQDKFTGESDENAWQTYQRILVLDPDHHLASSGHAQIIGILKSNAEYAADEHLYEEAAQWLIQLDSIQPEDPFQQELRQYIANLIAEDLAQEEADRLEEERIRLLDKALSDASAAMQASPPEFLAAYDLYQHALELEADNTVAQEGLASIHQQRIKYAKKAISSADFVTAATQIERLEKTGLEAAKLESLKSTLQQAQVKAEAGAKAEALAKAQKEAQLAQSEKPPITEQSASPEITTSGKTATVAEVEVDTDKSGTPPVRPAQKPAQNTVQTPEDQGVTTIEVDVHKTPPTKVATNTKQPNKVATAKPAAQSPLSKGIKAYYGGDYNTAFSVLHPLAEANSARAQFRLGIMYHQGRTVIKNEELARKWIARALPSILHAAQKGQAWAQADLGTAYELGIGVKRSLASAAGWYQKSANQGYIGGQTNLGVLYGTGAGVKYDRKKAIFWLKKAAVQGDKVAQDNLQILNAR